MFDKLYKHCFVICYTLNSVTVNGMNILNNVNKKLIKYSIDIPSILFGFICCSLAVITKKICKCKFKKNKQKNGYQIIQSKLTIKIVKFLSKYKHLYSLLSLN